VREYIFKNRNLKVMHCRLTGNCCSFEIQECNFADAFTDYNDFDDDARDNGST
jgi:hypothetical protein